MILRKLLRLKIVIFHAKDKMWIIGHSALAYLFIKPIYIGLKKELIPRQIILIFIFANMLDSLHFGPLRWISHNLVGALIYSGIWIIILLKLNIIHKNEVIFLYLAVFTHILGDFFISGFDLFLIVHIWNFNSIEHLTIEFFITLLFIISFIFSKDYRRLKEYLRLKPEKVELLNKKKYFQKHRYYFIIILFFIYYLFLLTQFLIYSIDLWNNITIGFSYLAVKLLVFSVFLGDISLFSTIIIKSSVG
ncbi:MAG: hypothetical protein ACFFBY_00665 [Promethearchaeota archaeon]